jgi:hypothetical protein
MYLLVPLWILSYYVCNLLFISGLPSVFIVFTHPKHTFLLWSVSKHAMHWMLSSRSGSTEYRRQKARYSILRFQCTVAVSVLTTFPYIPTKHYVKTASVKSSRFDLDSEWNMLSWDLRLIREVNGTLFVVLYLPLCPTILGAKVLSRSTAMWTSMERITMTTSLKDLRKNRIRRPHISH